MLNFVKRTFKERIEWHNIAIITEMAMNDIWRNKALNVYNKNNSSSTSSVRSSGTKSDGMEKTDSVLNLTKPALYGIYNDNSVLNLEKESEDIEDYAKGSKGAETEDSESSYFEERGEQHRPSKTGAFTIIRKVIVSLTILVTSSFLYNEISRHVHNSHLKVIGVADEPLIISNMFLRRFIHSLKPSVMLNGFQGIESADSKALVYADRALALMFQGLFMTLLHPCLDYIAPGLSKRLLSSAPNSGGYNSIVNDLVRSLVTFLGISYAVRKIEWNSSLQVLMIFSLLNPGLWLLLDGTINGFLSSLIIATVACSSVYWENRDFFNHYQFFQGGSSRYDFVAIWLFVGSFFFCGVIIFGKLGRALLRY